MLAKSAVKHGFEPQSGQTKGCKMAVCCLFAKHQHQEVRAKTWIEAEGIVGDNRF